MAITLYHFQSARSVRPRWMLEELGLPYTIEREEMGNYSDDLKARSPLGKIPFLIDGTVELSESTAIVHYLSERYGQGRYSVGPDHAMFPRYVQWLHAAEGTLMEPLFMQLRHTRLLPEDQRNPEEAQRGKEMAERVLAWLNRDLGGEPFIAGDTFTAADVCVGYSIYIARVMKLLDERYPALVAYWDGLKARPALQAALAD
jgi:glutathione S-transferase